MDARITRTRASLQDALLALARERALDEITIADIADHAGVNRSTFYQHYPDKDSLLADAIDAVLSEAEPRLLEITPPTQGAPPQLATYLAHIEQNAALYRMALGSNGSALVTGKVRDRIRHIVTQGVSRANVPAFEGIPIEVVAAGITGTAFGAISAWLDMEPRPSHEKAVAWLWTLLAGPGEGWGLTTPPAATAPAAGRRPV